jgi:AcrR family transcriptional regulator
MAEAKLDTKIRREQIVEAALELIATQGPRRLSIAAVARRVGLVPSGIYRHFTNKDALLDAVLTRIEDRLKANVLASRESQPKALPCLKEVMMRHIRFLREGRVLSVPRMIFGEDADDSARRRRILHIFKQYIGQIAEIVAEGQAAGDIRQDADPQTVAMMLFGLVVPAGIQWHLTEGGFDVTRHAQRSWPLFLAAVTPNANILGSN